MKDMTMSPDEGAGCDEIIEIEFTLTIQVDNNGDFDDNDPYGEWAGNPDNKNHNWYSDVYGGEIMSSSEAAEHIYDLLDIMDVLDLPPGTHTLKGTAYLGFNISGLSYTSEMYQEPDGLGDYTWEQDITVNRDNAEAEFNLSASCIKDLTVNVL